MEITSFPVLITFSLIFFSIKILGDLIYIKTYVFKKLKFFHILSPSITGTNLQLEVSMHNLNQTKKEGKRERKRDREKER